MELTIKKAKKQGYTHYGYKSKEWQIIKNIHDDVFTCGEIDKDDFEDIVLFEKEPRTTIITEKEIKELLSDYVAEKHYEECSSDSDDVYNAIDSIDYSGIIKLINKELENNKYWMLTDIKLINNK